MDAKQQFVLKVLKRYGVLIAFDGDLDKVPRLPRAEEDQPVTFAGLSRLLCRVLEDDDIRVFRPCELKGGSHLATLKRDADMEELNGLLKSIRADAVEETREKMLDDLEKERLDYEVEKSNRRNREASYEDALKDLRGEVHRLASQNTILRQNLADAKSANMSVAEERKRLQADRKMVSGENQILINKVEALERFIKHISDEEKARVRKLESETWKAIGMERRTVDCKCSGEVENCVRCFGKGEYVVDGHGNIV